jgi:hypothetical protein
MQLYRRSRVEGNKIIVHSANKIQLKKKLIKTHQNTSRSRLSFKVVVRCKSRLLISPELAITSCERNYYNRETDLSLYL